MGAASSSVIRAIVLGGLIAGTIDVGAACVINGRSIPFILHAIAGGLLAQRSFAGGTATVLLGFFLQELMSIVIAAIYVLAAQKLALLTQRWVVFGLLYGVGIFVVMNYVVMPLSAWGHASHFTMQKFLENLAAMLLFGLIVSYFTQRRALPTVALPVTT
jgi:uncharacterized membrane protein YagU involved in acid resistance